MKANLTVELVLQRAIRVQCQVARATAHFGILARVWWGAAEGSQYLPAGETWYRLATASQLEDFFRELRLATKPNSAHRSQTRHHTSCHFVEHPEVVAAAALVEEGAATLLLVEVREAVGSLEL